MKTDIVATILLVDDEPRNLDVLESILNAPDYRLVRAQTADEALLALVDGEFAVIVLDIRMPGMSGLELANLVKQRKRTQHIPIIFLTAYYQEDKYVLEGYGVGAVDYLTKPVNAQILRSKVAVFAELFRSTRALAVANQALELEVTQRLQQMMLPRVEDMRRIAGLDISGLEPAAEVGGDYYDVVSKDGGVFFGNRRCHRPRSRKRGNRYHGPDRG